MAKKISNEIEEAEIVAPPAKQDATKNLVAYADFSVADRAIKEGDVFTPPFNWTRNLPQEELLLSTKQKSGVKVGMVFTYEGEFVNPSEKNPEKRERRVHNLILPLEER